MCGERERERDTHTHTHTAEAAASETFGHEGTGERCCDEFRHEAPAVRNGSAEGS